MYLVPGFGQTVMRTEIGWVEGKVSRVEKEEVSRVERKGERWKGV